MNRDNSPNHNIDEGNYKGMINYSPIINLCVNIYREDKQNIIYQQGMKKKNGRYSCPSCRAAQSTCHLHTAKCLSHGEHCSATTRFQMGPFIDTNVVAIRIPLRYGQGQGWIMVWVTVLVMWGGRTKAPLLRNTGYVLPALKLVNSQ